MPDETQSPAPVEDRWIFHVDMDAFYASVEQRDHPQLKGKPVVVGGSPDRRGVVCTASYEARRYGVRSAMPTRTAHRLCPAAIFVPVRMQQYRAVSAQIFEIFHDTSPTVEGLSVDEAFLDVSHLVRTTEEAICLARKLKDAIWHATGLTTSVGIASNKFLAKLASDLQKPNGITVVPRQEEAISAFLAPLQVGQLWGIGPKSAARLERCGIRKVGDIQRCGAGALTGLLGAAGAERLFALSHGRDSRAVATSHVRKSISSEQTFAKDCADSVDLEGLLLEMIQGVAEKIAVRGLQAASVVVKMRWADFRTVTRQQAIPAAQGRQLIMRTALDLFRRNWDGQPLRLLGSGLQLTDRNDGPQQLELFAADEPLSDHDRALDAEIAAWRSARRVSSSR